MGLSDDQKAILRLLAQRGEQGYDDLAALMGISADEVHERARAAAAELEAEGIPAPQIPQPPAGSTGEEAAPPAEPAPVPPKPEPPAEPEPPKPAEQPEPAAIAKPAAAPKQRTAGDPRPKLSLPKSGGARAAIAAGAAVVVLVIVILALGGGGDSDDSPSSSGGGAASEETATNAANPKLTQAVLNPIDGSDAQGLATFGRVKNRLALQVEAQGLEPTGKGESYTIWLYESADKMLPLASTAVGENGKIGAQVEVPTEVLGYLANETFDQIDVSQTSNATLKASLAKATEEKKAPIYTGSDVLRGTISGPIIGAAKKANEE